MDKKLDTLYEICETVSRELDGANDKIRKSGGELSAGDVDYLDKLTHTMKSLKTTIAMMEAEDGYSGRYMPRNDGRSYADRGGNSYYDDGVSYARGRKRDSMGRYSRRGYSYAEEMDGMMDDLREMMPDMPAEKQRTIQRLMDELKR